MTMTGAHIVSDPAAARTALDAHVRDTVSWHFDPATGSPFWLDYAKKLGWDPRREIGGFALCPGASLPRGQNAGRSQQQNVYFH